MTCCTTLFQVHLRGMHWSQATNVGASSPLTPQRTWSKLSRVRGANKRMRPLRGLKSFIQELRDQTGRSNRCPTRQRPRTDRTGRTPRDAAPSGAGDPFGSDLQSCGCGFDYQEQHVCFFQLKITANWEDSSAEVEIRKELKILIGPFNYCSQKIISFLEIKQ